MSPNSPQTDSPDIDPVARAVTSPFGWLGLMIMLFFTFMWLTACSTTFGDDLDGNDQMDRLTLTYDFGGDAVELSYLRAGDTSGQQVIFVHGTPGSGSGWARYLNAVPGGREYIAIDRPGFGRTRPRREEVRLDAQAAAVKAVMQTRGGKKPILVGHSLGGPIVAAVAANYPDAVGGVIELAGSMDPDLEKILFIQYVGELPPFVWLIPTALRNTNREVFALEDELRLLDDKLHKVTAPVVIIHGTEDDLVPYANVAYMQRRFVSAEPMELITLEGQNHFLPWNSKPVLDAALDRMISGFPGAPRFETTITTAR